eukprot:TRINITY_DN3858_c0_g1_i1.p1 TRINITY_DN3858_c0_g1~~TRINITY_DN3858_c0_g1_i1.p1  ORF type:complete len:544 (+),score=78.88 TRINITY_DN3858_c0_g1_i1:36-1667(+)
MSFRLCRCSCVFLFFLLPSQSLRPFRPVRTVAMKFGQKLAELRESHLDSFEAASWTDYKQLKKLLKDDNVDEDEYFLFWEEQLQKVAQAVACHSKSCDEDLKGFVDANCEALRKAAKKWDKSKATGNQQQPMRKRMTDCVLHTNLRARDRATSPTASPTASPTPFSPQPIGKPGDQEPERAACTSADHAPLKQSTTLKSRISEHFSLHSVVEGVLCFLLLLVVAFEPLLIDLTKGEGHKEMDYVASTVILLQACLSTATGCVLAFLINPNRDDTAQRRGNSRWEDAVRCVHWKNIRAFLPTGLLRAVADSLTIVVMNYISPSSYMVLSQSRLVLTGIFAQLFLPKSPNRAQWHGLLVIVVGMLTFKMSHGAEDGGDESENSAWGLFLLVVAVLCKVGASIWLERALQTNEDEGIIIQSANISAGTILPAFIFAMVEANFVGEGAHGVPISFSKMFHGMTELVGVLACFLFLKDWFSNLVIKRFSAVVKYVIYAAAVVVTYVAEVTLFSGSFNIVSLLVTVVVMQGAIMFADGKSFVTTGPKKK